MGQFPHMPFLFTDLMVIFNNENSTTTFNRKYQWKYKLILVPQKSAFTKVILLLN